MAGALPDPTKLLSRMGAVFDWDGVVIDSSRQHAESWERLAGEAGKTLPPGHFLRGFGMKNEVIISELGWSRDAGEIRRLSLRKEELYREIVKESHPEPLPGVREFLERLAAGEIPCALGSSTHRLNITLSLERLGLGRFFRTLVTAEDVSRGKPDPEVFLLAAARLGVAPPRCVVFEDAPVGLAAARSAGMPCVAVSTTHPPAALADAALVVGRLDEIELSALEVLLG